MCDAPSAAGGCCPAATRARSLPPSSSPAPRPPHVYTTLTPPHTHAPHAMQSARSLMSHHVETPESLRGHGEFHGRGNIDPAYKQAAFDKSVFQRILNRFPQNVRVPGQETRGGGGRVYACRHVARGFDASWIGMARLPFAGVGRPEERRRGEPFATPVSPFSRATYSRMIPLSRVVSPPLASPSPLLFFVSLSLARSFSRCWWSRCRRHRLLPGLSPARAEGQGDRDDSHQGVGPTDRAAAEGSAHSDSPEVGLNDDPQRRADSANRLNRAFPHSPTPDHTHGTASTLLHHSHSCPARTSHTLTQRPITNQPDPTDPTRPHTTGSAQQERRSADNGAEQPRHCHCCSEYHQIYI